MGACCSDTAENHIRLEQKSSILLNIATINPESNKEHTFLQPKDNKIIIEDLEKQQRLINYET